MTDVSDNLLQFLQKASVKMEKLFQFSASRIEAVIFLLEKADLLIILLTSAPGITKMNKPEKIYLNNPNLVTTLTDHQSNQGTIRETDYLSVRTILYPIHFQPGTNRIVFPSLTSISSWSKVIIVPSVRFN